MNDLVSEYQQYQDATAEEEGEFDEAFGVEVSEGVEKLRKDHQDDGASDECSQAPSQKEVDDTLGVLKKRLLKSAGPDGVTNWMMVWGGQCAAKALHGLYSRAWEEGELPSQWDSSTIKYLHKIGSPTEVSNYRPISLISGIAKTFTRTWLLRLAAIVGPTCTQLPEQG